MVNCGETTSKNGGADPLPTDIHGHPLRNAEPLHIHGRPVKEIDSRMPMNTHERLYGLFAKVIGLDLIQIYIGDVALGRY